MKISAAILMLFALPMVVLAREAVDSATNSPKIAAAEISPGDRLQSLDAGQIQQAISAIRERHVEGAKIDDSAMQRATLQGLLESLEPGADLIGDKAPAEKVSPFRSEILEGDIGYVRLGSLQTENLAQLDAALQEFTAKKVHGVVLDLRATPDSQNFELAAQVAERFVPIGAAVFTLRRAGAAEPKIFTAASGPLFQGVLVVVVDAGLGGAGEALAATLRRHARAMLVGTTTSGRAVEFSTVPLGSGQNLRLAVAAAQVEGAPDLYPKGIRPDLLVEQTPEDRETILELSLEKGAGAFVFEKERAQLNEAALVAGTNPELVASPETSPAIFDRPLQRAVDLVTAIRLFRK
jgi:C-terminal processing protease CtpA/Prc